MKIFLALCAISGLCACLNAADVADPPLAVYYSFEAPPPPAVFNEMQSEMARILAPAGLQVTWRSLENRPSESEDFREVLVLRFRGTCTLDKATSTSGSVPNVFGLPLAETELVDGHVLPFGEVECDQLRHFIAPMARRLDGDYGNVTLGRAVARVAAHEMYHMLTGSGAHGRSGIARAEHYWAELTAPSFGFAKPETEWLRSWVDKQVASTGSLDSIRAETDELDTETSGSINIGTR